MQSVNTINICSKAIWKLVLALKGVFGFITARKLSCGKVMFLYLSVILLTWGGVLCPGGSLSVRPPRTVKTGRYASYWNAFLFTLDLCTNVLISRFKLY